MLYGTSSPMVAWAPGSVASTPGGDPTTLESLAAGIRLHVSPPTASTSAESRPLEPAAAASVATRLEAEVPPIRIVDSVVAAESIAAPAIESTASSPAIARDNPRETASSQAYAPAYPAAAASQPAVPRSPRLVSVGELVIVQSDGGGGKGGDAPAGRGGAVASAASPARLGSYGSVGAGGSHPSALKNRPPRYPEEAIRNSWEGTVVLRLHIAASGDVAEALVESGSGFAVLDDAAVATVKLWRFRPARREGRPVDAVVKLPVVFDLSPSLRASEFSARLSD